MNIAQLVATLELDTRGFAAGAQRAAAQTQALEQRLNRIGSLSMRTGQVLSAALTAPIVGIGFLAGRASIQFESAFAGVRKTVDATEEQFEQLRQEIRAMSREMPESASNIARLVEAGGQLGIQVENLTEFARTMVMIGESTNLTADVAADQFARLANIMRTPQDQFDNLGSAVVDLGNKFAATEAEIVSMAMRIAGAGSVIDLTEGEVLGFATALTSLGIEVEAGGTAISRVMLTMFSAIKQGGDELKAFASVAGMTVADFQSLFERDAAGAISRFIGGLGQLKAAGADITSILEALGLNEIRVRDALLRLAGNQDLLNNALRVGNQAFQENTALQTEYGRRVETTAAQLEIFWNRLVDTAITLGDRLAPTLIEVISASEPLLNLITAIAEGFASLPQPVQTAVIGMAAFLAALGPMLMLLGSTAQGISILAVALTTLRFQAAAQGALAFAAALGPIPLALAAITAAAIVAGDSIAGFINKTLGLEKKIDLSNPEDMSRLPGWVRDELEKRRPEIESRMRERDAAENARIDAQLLQARASMTEVGQTASDLGIDFEALDDALNSLGGGASAATTKISALADGVIDFAEATGMGMSAAVAGGVEALNDLATAEDDMARKAFDLQKTLSKVAVTFRENEQAARKLALSLSRQVLSSINAAQSALFGQPTKEQAQLELQLAMLNKSILGLGPDIGQPNPMRDQLERQRDMLQNQLDLLQAEADIQQKQIQAANQALLTEAERRQRAMELTEAMAFASENVRVLSAQLGKDLIPEMETMREQVSQLHGVMAVLTDESLRQNLIPTIDLAAVRAGLMADGMRDAATAANGLGNLFEKLSNQVRRATEAIAPLDDVILDAVKAINQNSLQPFEPAPVLGFPTNAAGTPSWRGGWTLVGEEGPELVRLPAGTQIFSAVETRDLLTGGPGMTVNFHAHGMTDQELRAALYRAVDDFMERRHTRSLLAGATASSVVG